MAHRMFFWRRISSLSLSKKRSPSQDDFFREWIFLNPRYVYYNHNSREFPLRTNNTLSHSNYLAKLTRTDRQHLGVLSNALRRTFALWVSSSRKLSSVACRQIYVAPIPNTCGMSHGRDNMDNSFDKANSRDSILHQQDVTCTPLKSRVRSRFWFRLVAFFFFFFLTLPTAVSSTNRKSTFNDAGSTVLADEMSVWALKR